MRDCVFNYGFVGTVSFPPPPFFFFTRFSNHIRTELQNAFYYKYCINVYSVEGGGAVALAAAQASLIEMDGRTTVIVLSGANVDDQTLLRVLNNNTNKQQQE